MYLTVQGLVVRVSEYNDRDCFLTLLTKDHGRITVKARNVRRKNSAIAACCQLLTLSEFNLFEYKGSYVVNDAKITELFTGLRTDLNKLSLATYFAQVIELIAQEDFPSSQLHPLILNCLYALSYLQESEHKVKAVFELRCACLAGFTPDLSECRECGNPWPDLFDASEGSLTCKKCQQPGSSGIRMPISDGILAAMRYICQCDPKRLFSFSLSSEGLEALSNITELFLTCQLERGFSALDFYKSLCI